MRPNERMQVTLTRPRFALPASVTPPASAGAAPAIREGT